MEKTQNRTKKNTFDFASENLEYKASVTNTFLKTVSAYANYGTGEILFGVADDGSINGVENPKKTCLDIENRINDSIDPIPEYTLSIIETNSGRTEPVL